MQQRQLRLGDILDDYCPRERRITNHAVVAMIGPDVKQTRCTTCDTEHEYKHGKVPRQRRKPETPAALYSQVLAGGPKRVAHDPAGDDEKPEGATPGASPHAEDDAEAPVASHAAPSPASEAPPETEADPDEADNVVHDDAEEGPVHRPLIRATLPRAEGQPPPTRPAPDFTIRHPGGRPNRFRHRAGRGPQFQGNRSNGNMGGGGPRSGVPRPGGGRPPHAGSPRIGRRHGPKRQK
jgi:translation initiation factor IF-2